MVSVILCLDNILIITMDHLIRKYDKNELLYIYS